jgi:hypothetical protein
MELGNSGSDDIYHDQKREEKASLTELTLLD